MTLLEIFYISKLNFKVIFKSVLDPDDTCLKVVSWHEWVKASNRCNMIRNVTCGSDYSVDCEFEGQGKVKQGDLFVFSNHELTSYHHPPKNIFSGSLMQSMLCIPFLVIYENIYR